MVPVGEADEINPSNLGWVMFNLTRRLTSSYSSSRV